MHVLPRGPRGIYLQQVIGCVQDAWLVAAQHSLDQLLGYCRLLMDDGQVQRTVGKKKHPGHTRPRRFGKQDARAD